MKKKRARRGGCPKIAASDTAHARGTCGAEQRGGLSERTKARTYTSTRARAPKRKPLGFRSTAGARGVGVWWCRAPRASSNGASGYRRWRRRGRRGGAAAAAVRRRRRVVQLGVEDVAISAGLVAVQLAGAAYMVVLAPVLALGLDPLFLVTFGSLATGLFTLPFAINLERKRWPSHLNANHLLLRLFLLALGGYACITCQSGSGF